jgi:hypothetical protein
MMPVIAYTSDISKPRTKLGVGNALQDQILYTCSFSMSQFLLNLKLFNFIVNLCYL